MGTNLQQQILISLRYSDPKVEMLLPFFNTTFSFAPLPVFF